MELCYIGTDREKFEIQNFSNTWDSILFHCLIEIHKKKKKRKLLFIQSNRRIECSYDKDTVWRLRGRRTGIRVHFRSECRDFACIVRVCTRFQTERVRRHLSTRHLSYPVGRSCSMLTYWMVVFTCVDLYCVALDTGTNEKRMTFFTEN